MIEIVVLIVSIITLVALVILSIFYFLNRKNDKQNASSLDMKEIGILTNKIETLSSSLKEQINLVIAQEINNVLTINNKNNEQNNEKLERFQLNITKSINERFDAFNTQFAENMNNINKKVDTQLSEGFKGTAETIAQVRERLQAIDDAQKNIETLSKDVISLRTVLEGNQSRGQYGEYQLSMVLHNVFGDTIGCYQEQYTLKKMKDGNDVRADAVVFVPEPNKMICIDSKFPFKDYERLLNSESEEDKEKYLKDFEGAVKKHITAIKNKYIIEGKTASEAIMFIPNDGVFAFIHHNLDSAVEYARSQRVILTSPSTLPAILYTISMVRVEHERSKNAKQISVLLTKLGKDFSKFSEEWARFSSQLNTVTRTREALDKRFERINTKFGTISDSSSFEELEDSSSVSQIENNNDE